MRNERWINRFLYSWNDTLFFDALDVYYQPRTDHFLAPFDDEVRARFRRSGIWWSHRHNPALPAQGWKIHVSAGLSDVHEVARESIRYLTGRNADFKVALDLNIYEMLCSKGMARTSGGKLVTVYPRDDEEFRAVLSDLADLLDGAEGAYVLSDVRYRGCKALYFRYGQFLDTHRVDVLGRRIPQIEGPDGPVADDRAPGKALPWWQPWPFDDWKPDDPGGAGELLGGRFRVTGAIQFSNSGGVYTAEDEADGSRRVILKEARPHTNVNTRGGYDATDVLGREWSFLNRLAGTGRFPAPVAAFQHWEHHFIAEELIDGTDIRSLLLQHNPLTRPGLTAGQSREFLRIFLRVSRGMARAVQAAHHHGVVLGDLSAPNLIVDPDTLDVSIVDLEACRLAGKEDGAAHLAQPVELFTPGFSHSRRSAAGPVAEDDLYSLATNMAYFIFPIAAMSYLREDVFDIYRVFTDDLGWPPEIHQLLIDMTRARVTLTDAIDLLGREDELAARVRPELPATAAPSGFGQTEAGVAAFIAATADTGRETLFPVDPFASVSNPLSLGFGASGVLWALAASGVPVRPEWRNWLSERLARIDTADYPAGLMSGLAGLAWAAGSLGLAAPAQTLLAAASRRAAEAADYTYYYGLAGVGMTNLHFYLRGRAERDLAAARDCARALAETAHRDGGGAYWLNEFATEGPLTGLGFGQAGVALFLLRLSQVTGDASVLELGRAALAFEMDNARRTDDGLVTFTHQGTAEPYVEVGSAGVAQVLLRYGDLDAAREVLKAVDVGHAVLPAYAFGLSGVTDALLDAAAMTGDRTYRDTALRQLDVIRKVFLFSPAARFGLAPDGGTELLAVPGEGLLRCATDYLTGSAGVLRVLHRVNAGGTADFLLDEVTR